MKSDAMDFLEALGPVKDYRDFGSIEQVVEKFQSMENELREELEYRLQDWEGFLFALEVMERMLITLGSRSSTCQLQHPDMSCENVDIVYIMKNWIEFTKCSLKKKLKNDLLGNPQHNT